MINFLSVTTTAVSRVILPISGRSIILKKLLKHKLKKSGKIYPWPIKVPERMKGNFQPLSRNEKVHPCWLLKWPC